MAKELDMVVMVHTPHRDKKTGTIRSMEIAIEHGIAPGRVIIDHNNEETVQDVLDRGFWAAFTLYPHTKMGNERMVEIARRYGSRAHLHRFELRLGRVRSAGGAEDRAAHARAWHLRRTSRKSLSECARGLRADRPDAGKGLVGAGGRSTSASLFEGNSVLRGQQPRVDELQQIPERIKRSGVQVIRLKSEG